MSTPPIYEKLQRMSKRKLNSLEYDHRQHLQRFTQAKDSKGEGIQGFENRYQKLAERAVKELAKEERGAEAMAMAMAMEMRRVRADLLIARSVRALLRSNQLYHKLMVILIQDTKAGVDYNPDRIRDIIPAEFGDMIDRSVLSTNLTGLLGDLRSEVESLGDDK